MPIPNASWSGDASTAAASGVTEKRSAPSAGRDGDELRRGLVVGPLAHPPLVELGGRGQLGRSSAAPSAAASARYSPSWSPRWIIPDVTAPSSFVNTRNWNILRASGSSVAMGGTVATVVRGAGRSAVLLLSELGGAASRCCSSPCSVPAVAGCASDDDATVASVPSTVAAAPTAAVGDPELRAELLAMLAEDQAVRTGVAPPGDDRTADELFAAMDAVDAANTARIVEIFDAHGWPGWALVGEDGSTAAWAIVQHADLRPDVQRAASSCCAPPSPPATPPPATSPTSRTACSSPPGSRSVRHAVADRRHRQPRAAHADRRRRHRRPTPRRRRPGHDRGVPRGARGRLRHRPDDPTDRR